MPFDNTPLNVPVLRLPVEAENDLAVLMMARQRISDSSQWIRRAYKKGEQYCAEGALIFSIITYKQKRIHAETCRLTLTGDQSLQRRRLQHRLERHIPNNYLFRLSIYNDASTTTHADVLKLFDAAIAELEAKRYLNMNLLENNHE